MLIIWKKREECKKNGCAKQPFSGLTRKLVLGHHFDDLFIRLLHALAAQTAEALDGVLHALFHQAVAAVELLALAVHLMSEEACLHSHGDLGRAGGLGAVAHDAAGDGQGIDQGVGDLFHAAAMEEGKIVSDTPMLTKGIFDKYKDKGFTGYCLEYTTSGRTHGEITASQALSVSCNWFFFQLGEWLENDQSDPYAKAMGFGESTGVELYENKGYRLNLATKKRLYKGVDANTVYVADRLQSAIGQGDNRVTPLQLCVYASTLANKGTRYRATFMNRVVSADYRSLISENKPEVMSVLEISDETYQTYVEGMKLVAREGTGRRTFATYPIDIACKTGTAETGLHIGSDNGAFVAFAPANNPQIAVSVYVERAGHGSTVAGIAKEIFDSYFDVDEVGEVVIYENTIS